MALTQHANQIETALNQSNHQLSVVIPAYNEEDGIAEILDRVLSVQAGSRSDRRVRAGSDRR